MGAALASLVAGGVSLALSPDAAEMLAGWRWIFPIGGGASAALTLGCLRTRRLPKTITVEGGAAPAGTLEALLWIMAAGAVILIPSLRYLLRLFAKRLTPVQVKAQSRAGPTEEPR